VRAAATRVVPVLALALAPVVAVVVMFLIAIDSDSLALDFQNEIYPESKALLAGELEFPGPHADLSQGSNHIWPPLVAMLAAPLTLLPVDAANVVVALAGLVSFALALWIVGVRDWRVFGAAALWAPVTGEMRTAHLTLFLCLLIAVAWRMRRARYAAGLAIGLVISLKFLLWPLLLWLAARRRYGAAALGACVSAASLLLLLPYIGILEYARLLRRLGETFDQDSYSPFGLLVQLGASDTAARAVALAIGVGVIAAAWRRQSFVLFVAAALLLSPIVWLDYYALLAIPLAVVRPRFTVVWLLPVLTWGLPAAGAEIGTVEGVTRVVLVFGVLTWYVARREAPREVRSPLASSPAAG
jgi:Glycosyltransferase family 87